MYSCNHKTIVSERRKRKRKGERGGGGGKKKKERKEKNCRLTTTLYNLKLRVDKTY